MSQLRSTEWICWKSWETWKQERTNLETLTSNTRSSTKRMMWTRSSTRSKTTCRRARPTPRSRTKWSKSSSYQSWMTQSTQRSRRRATQARLTPRTFPWPTLPSSLRRTLSSRKRQRSTSKVLFSKWQRNKFTPKWMKSSRWFLRPLLTKTLRRIWIYQ